MISKPDSYFSEEAKEMKASAIRELLKVVKSGDILSMAGGMPNPKSFPIKMIKDISHEILEERRSEVLQYGTTKGYSELRTVLSQRLKEQFNVEIDPANLLITAGSQQGLYLISRVFIDPGDPVIVGAPTYLAALTAFKQFDPAFHTVPLDENGMDMEKLERKLERLEKSPKLLYTVPTFQNPAGVTMPMERRAKLLDLASEYNFLVVEDGPYNELRYEGEPIDPIISKDKEGRVLFLGTFSKVLAPGFRIGWIAANGDFIRKIEIAKQSVDLCTNTLSQHIACEYMKTSRMGEQIKKIKKLYKRKREIALEALEKYMPEGIEWTKPKGGMFIWLTAPQGIDTEETFEEARKNKVAYVPGPPFFAKNPERNTLRLNYTYLEDEKIAEGVKRIAKTLKKYMD